MCFSRSDDRMVSTEMIKAMKRNKDELEDQYEQTSLESLENLVRRPKNNKATPTSSSKKSLGIGDPSDVIEELEDSFRVARTK